MKHSFKAFAPLSIILYAILMVALPFMSGMANAADSDVDNYGTGKYYNQ